jgi:CheY-like chemotaxis protein
MVTKGNVLVVDDEVNLCRILGAKLAKSGYSVVAMHDGLQAVEKVRETDFDVVLLDLILPKMDGLTALAEIRGMRSSLPVIVMTACENAEALAQAGWRVEITTPSAQAPTDIAKYQLLVLCWAIYDFNPAPTITNQVHRLGNLNGIDTTIIIIGGGLDPLNVKDSMNRIVADANGTVVQTITMFRSQRNLGLLQEEAAKLTP